MLGLSWLSSLTMHPMTPGRVTAQWLRHVCIQAEGTGQGDSMAALQGCPNETMTENTMGASSQAELAKQKHSTIQASCCCMLD